MRATKFNLAVNILVAIIYFIKFVMGDSYIDYFMSKDFFVCPPDGQKEWRNSENPNKNITIYQGINLLAESL